MSSTSSIGGTYTNRLRITGMATGLDVDGIVKQLMMAEVAKVDKVKQNRQLTLWKQDAYRDILTDINTLKSTYFDVLKSDSYMLGSKNYGAFDVASTKDTVATATAGSGSVAGTYSIKDIVMATKASQTGSPVKVKQASDIVSFPVTITSGVNDKLNINVGGVNYGTITIEAGNYTMSDLADNINNKLAGIKLTSDTTATSKVIASVSNDGTSIEFSPVVAITKTNNTINITKGGTNYKIILDEGNYSLKGLANKLNSELSNIVKDGTNDTENLTDALRFKAVTDGSGSSIQFDMLNGNTVSVGGGIIGTSTGMSITGNPNVASNKLAFGGINIDPTNDTFTVTIGGTAYNVKLDDTGATPYTDMNALMNAINDALKNHATKVSDNSTVDISGMVKAQLSLDGNKLQFANSSGLQFSMGGAAAKTFGFSSSLTDMYVTGYDKMSSLISSANSSDGTVNFTINNVQFKYNFLGADKDKTINDILNDISSKAGVNASYNELGQKFTISSYTTGADQKVIAADNPANVGLNTSFLNTLFGGSSINISGTNASATITDPLGNSSTVSKPMNTFTIDGVTYNLLANTKAGSLNVGDNSGLEVKLTLTPNTQKVVDKIKTFIDKYNEIIDKIKTKIQEKRDNTFMPLTDDQKKDMTDDQIKKWEEKVKTGLLANDSNLQDMLSTLRQAFYSPVSGSGILLSDIGLSTSSDYLQQGKIIIDEAKLKDAIQNHGEQVKNIFMKDSPISYDADHITDKDRYSQIGIFQRINDIFKDYTRTSRNSSGLKGILVQEAGLKGDLSEINSTMSLEVLDYDKKIKTLNKKLAEKEEAYYQKYSKLEATMQKLNAQSNWMTQQFAK